MAKSKTEEKEVTAVAEDQKKKKTPKFVWLKVTAYIDEENRVSAGFYSFDKVPERLTRLSRSAIEIFDEAPEARKLYEIADSFGVDSGKVKKDGELLEMLVAEPKPF